MTRDLFLRALREEPVDRPPVWMMRQAGRYLPEYRETKEQAGGFLALCRSPEACVEVVLQPLRRFDFDAAILFSDIMVPMLPAVPGLDYAPGPTLPAPVTDPAALGPAGAVDEVDFVYETIRLLRAELDVPLIGFAGTPATVGTYLAEGGSSKNFTALRKMLHADPERAHAFLARLEELTLAYLERQVDAGVHVVQLFDSWGGEFSAAQFEEFLAPGLRRIVAALKPRVPVIYFARGPMRDVGATAYGIDWRVDLAAAREHGPVQGNLDPTALFAAPEAVRAAVARMKAPLAGRTGYVVNLGHGVLPGTPIESVHAFADAAREA